MSHTVKIALSMSYRCTRDGLRWLLSCCFLIGLICGAQTTQMPIYRPIVASTPIILDRNAASDREAIDLLNSALGASGGQRLWGTLKSSKERFNVKGRNRTSMQALLLDDWSSRAVKYRRGVVGSSGHAINHDSKASFSVQLASKSIEVPEFNQGHVLADHLPLASIALMLRSSSYVFRLVPPTQCSPESHCVDVYHQLHDGDVFQKDQEWEFSTSDGLPTAVNLRLPDIVHGVRQIWETVHFSVYTLNKSYLIPTTIVITLPGGIIQNRSVVDFLPNSLFDMAAFDKELAQ